MLCPICGEYSEDAKRARHLPRFVRCPHCSGYATGKKETVAYSAGYFSEEPTRQKRSVFSPLLDFFLWLRMRKIRRVLHPDITPLTPPSTEGGRGPRILDYGCGNGKLVAYLRMQGLDAEGYDPSPSAVALAQKIGLPVFGAVPNRQYDMAMFWHSLEHSDTPLRDILVLKCSLALRAQFLIAVPNGDALEARLFGESFFCYDWPFHRVHFTPKALTILLEKAGFRVLSVNHFNPEYTISSLVQTFLNLFLPKNAFYSFVSARRQTASRGKLFLLGLVSLLALVLFSPVLAIFFVVALLSKRTAAFIVAAEKI